MSTPTPVVLLLLLVAASTAHRNFGSIKTTGSDTWYTDGFDFFQQVELTHTFPAGTTDDGKSKEYTTKFALVADTIMDQSDSDINDICDMNIDDSTDEFYKQLFSGPSLLSKKTSDATVTYTFDGDIDYGNPLDVAQECTIIHTLRYTPLTSEAVKALEELSSLTTSENKFSKVDYADPDNWGPIILVVIIFNLSAGIVLAISMRILSMVRGTSNQSNLQGFTQLTTQTL